MASSPSTERSDVLRMGAILLALLAVTALVLLLTGGGDGGEDKVASRDGLLTIVEPQRLVLQPEGGGTPVTFAIRPIDARRLDLTHLRAHRDQGLASRVFFQREGGTRYALRVDDLQTSP